MPIVCPGTRRALEEQTCVSLVREALGGTSVTAPVADGPARPGTAARRPWLALVVLLLPSVAVGMNTYVLHIAVPAVSAALRPSGGQLVWIVDSYILATATFLIPGGALGDRFGRRRLLVLGSAGMAVASVLGALAPTPELLLAARIGQGIAGGLLMPATLAMIRVLFPDPRGQATALGAWTASFAVGGLIGPLAAGLLIERAWWGASFLVVAGFAAPAALLGPLVLPERRAPRTHPVDVAGLVLCAGAVLAAVYAVTRWAERGDGLGSGAWLVVAAGCAAGFVVRQRSTPEPLLDPRLWRSRAFAVPLLVNAAAFFAWYGTDVAVAQYLQLSLGLSPLATGLATLPATGGYLLGSAVAPAIMHRAGPHATLVSGAALSVAGFAVVTAAGGPHALAIVVTGSALFSLGLAPAYVATTHLVLGAVPEGSAGTASAVSETVAELGGGLGMAVMGSVALAARLASPAGPESTIAWARGFHVGEAVGTAVVAAAVVLAVVLLRPARERLARAAAGAATRAAARHVAAHDGPARVVPPRGVPVGAE